MSVPHTLPSSFVWKNAKLIRVIFVKSKFIGAANFCRSYHCHDGKYPIMVFDVGPEGRLTVDIVVVV